MIATTRCVERRSARWTVSASVRSYAVALGREPDAALRDDAGRAVAVLDGRDADRKQRPVDILIERVRDDAVGLVAALDCRLAEGPAEGVSILQLLVTRMDGRFRMTLEGVGDGG